MTSEPLQVTKLLIQLSDGDQTALDRLLPRVYGELHKMAKRLERAADRGNPQNLAGDGHARLELRESISLPGNGTRRSQASSVRYSSDRP